VSITKVGTSGFGLAAATAADVPVAGAKTDAEFTGALAAGAGAVAVPLVDGPQAARLNEKAKRK